MEYNTFNKVMAISTLMVKNDGDSESVDGFFRSNGIELSIDMLDDFMKRAVNENVDMKCLEGK